MRVRSVVTFFVPALPVTTTFFKFIVVLSCWQCAATDIISKRIVQYNRIMYRYLPK